MSRFGTFTINNKAYDLDDLTLDEVETIEDLCGGLSFNELNFGSAKTMKAMAFTLMRRDQPDLQMEDVGRVKVIDFLQPDEQMPALPPHGDEGPQSESAPDGSGIPPSVVSTAG